MYVDTRVHLTSILTAYQFERFALGSLNPLDVQPLTHHRINGTTERLIGTYRKSAKHANRNSVSRSNNRKATVITELGETRDRGSSPGAWRVHQGVHLRVHTVINSNNRSRLVLIRAFSHHRFIQANRQIH